LTLKQNPLRYEHLEDFIRTYNPENRHERTESERFRPFSYDELLQRDKVSLDLIWLRDESLDDSENLPPPDLLAQEIAEDLEAALSEFAQIAESLRSGSSE
jgi:type I restriction enzyme M protein